MSMLIQATIIKCSKSYTHNTTSKQAAEKEEEMKGNKKKIKDTLIKETQDCKKNGFITSICIDFYAVFILMP